MFNRLNAQRGRGILKTENGSNEQAPSQKLTHISPVEMFTIRYGDASGKAHTTVAFKINGTWFMDARNGENWVKDLAPVSDWLFKQIEQQVEDTKLPASIPTEDAVDVVGT